MMNEPIRLSRVTDRKLTMAKESRCNVTPTMCNYARQGLNESLVTQLARNISYSSADCNKYWETVMELSVMLDEKYGKCHKDINRILEYEIIPKLNKQNLTLASKYINENKDKLYGSKKLLLAIDETTVTERISNNHKALSKRFNIDKIARKAVRENNIDGGVNEICDLIDTYDISTQAKFNIALENITYAMHTAGYNRPVVEEVLDYFLLNNPIIPDTIYETMQGLVENSRILSQSDKDRVKYFTESSSTAFRDGLDKLAESCESEENKNIIKKTKNITTEKQAGVYIESVINMIREGASDADLLASSIFTIPLVSKVSKDFVTYKYSETIKNGDISDKLSSSMLECIKQIVDDDEDSLIVESTFIQVDSDLVTEYHIEEYAGMEYSEILESESYADTEDIKSIINDFKAEQKKSTGRFRYYLGKIYRKSPEQIIDGTPHILSSLRFVFILAPSVVVPVVGPVISIVFAIVDKLLAMKINDKQTEKLIRKLEAERDKVDADIEKKPNKKDELEKYGKCIDQCIKKVDAYRSAHISDEMIENRRQPKKKSSSSSKSDDELDFNLDDDFGFDLESVMVTMNALNNIAEAKNNNLQYGISKLLEDKTVEEISCLVEAASYCKRSVDMKYILDAAKKVKQNIPLKEAVILETNITNIEVQEAVNTIEDIVIEAAMVDAFNEVITEGFKLSKLKLLLNTAKSKVKDLSTKEKNVWRNIDIYSSNFVRGVEKALTSDRREAIIKGSIIPSFSKCIKSCLVAGGITILNPVLGVITALGMIGVSKALNHKERQLIYDEIDTELKVVEKQIEMANNDGDMKKYRTLLQVQKRLQREKQRIKYGVKVHGRNVPMYDIKGGDN